MIFMAGKLESVVWKMKMKFNKSIKKYSHLLCAVMSLAQSISKRNIVSMIYVSYDSRWRNRIEVCYRKQKKTLVKLTEVRFVIFECIQVEYISL